MNFYNYVGGDPVNKRDPSGLDCIPATAGSGGNGGETLLGCNDILVIGYRLDRLPQGNLVDVNIPNFGSLGNNASFSNTATNGKGEKGKKPETEEERKRRERAERLAQRIKACNDAKSLLNGVAITFAAGATAATVAAATVATAGAFPEPASPVLLLGSAGIVVGGAVSAGIAATIAFGNSKISCN